MSWEPSIAAKGFNKLCVHVTWSLCSRFIAISLVSKREIQILDARTLKKLQHFIHPHHSPQLFTFCPKSHLLTSLDDKSETIMNWDLQTGVLVSEIPMEKRSSTLKACSITYSECGMMFGVLFRDTYNEATTIGTYNALSGAYIHCHLIEGSVIKTIWTHGKCLQFATLGPGPLIVWEVEFASKYPPVEVESLPTPSNFDPSEKFLFLSTCSRLAFAHGETVSVWDVQHSKPLLDSVATRLPWDMSFSPDGSFFACGDCGPEICLWKESPTGYILHQKLIPNQTMFCKPLLSPNGQFIVNCGNYDLQLWHTTDPTISPSTAPTQSSKPANILEFSPDRLWVVAACLEDDEVIILNLESGIIQLTIDTCMRIYGLMVTGNTVVAVGEGKAIAWNLPTGDCALNARAGIKDSVWRRSFDIHLRSTLLESALISPDFSYFVTLERWMSSGRRVVTIYSASTGEDLSDQSRSGGGRLWFTPDGHEIWYGKDEGWAIVKDSESGIPRLNHIHAATKGPLGGFPWQSSCGCQIIEDRWILSSSGEQLLWLPPHWQTREINRVWAGQFLAFYGLQGVVIVKLPEE